MIVAGPSERGATSKFVICILPTISEDVFDTNKLLPLRNNVREVKSQEGLALATPHYNSSILEDMVVEHNCAWLQSVFLESEAMRDAVLLLKVMCFCFKSGSNRPPFFHRALKKLAKS
jgi:hypothetical protein